MKLTIYLFIILTTFTCANPKKDLVVKQSQSFNFPVIFGTYKSEIEEVAYIKLPNQIELKNTSYVNLNLSRITYESNYKSSYSRPQMYLYSVEGGSLKSAGNYNRKIIFGKKSLNYTYYVNYIIDTSTVTQQLLRPLLDKKKNKDTIHIGIVDFKKNNQELFNKLTSNDTIFTRFFLRHGSRKEKMTVVNPSTGEPQTITSIESKHERIKIPVKW
ncbi:hypothetical protein [Tenacibaculum mesophilum]|uniref:hypothetical protein n=1 Tax=Tenacibaculum mesophilum TaxID=104268 RepID=UPI00248F6A89|nr:hypothetical protein [Tenacibaculum mesophilum]